MSDLRPALERTDQFEVEGAQLTDLGRTIGVGTHERRVVDTAGFGG